MEGGDRGESTTEIGGGEGRWEASGERWEDKEERRRVVRSTHRTNGGHNEDNHFDKAFSELSTTLEGFSVLLHFLQLSNVKTQNRNSRKHQLPTKN